MGAKEGILWIKGKPGAGKSTTMGHIHRTTLNDVGNKKVIHFFYHGRGTELQKSPVGMFRSLAYQIFKELSPEDVCKIIPRTYTTTSILAIRWDLVEVKNLFSDALMHASPSHEVVILIDALDEAGYSETYEMGQYFHSQIAKGGTNIKACISCRHYPAPSNSLRGICIEDHNREDIRLYTMENVGSRASIVELVVEKSSGVFQWVRLVVPILARSLFEGESEQSVLAELKRIPKDLEDIFEHILRNVIQPKYLKRSFILFQLMCYAFEPLTLGKLRPLMNLNIEENITSDHQMAQQVIALSGGLAEVMPYTSWPEIVLHQSGSVQPIHQSVRDFLMVRGLQILATLCQYEFKRSVSATAHTLLFKTLYQYLDIIISSYVSFWNVRSRDIRGAHDLYDYLNKYMVDHAAESEDGYQSHLLDNPKRLSREYHIFNIPQFFRSETKDELSLLHVATWKKHLEVVDGLIRAGADCNAQTLKGDPPIVIATDSDDSRILESLLTAGAFANAVSTDNVPLLHTAVRRENAKSVQLLLDHWANPELRGPEHSSALEEAISLGNHEIASLLLQKSASVHLHRPCGSEKTFGPGMNSLQRAFVCTLESIAGLQYSRLEIFRLVLEKGKKIHSQDCFTNALYLAARWGRIDIASLCIESGAAINTPVSNIGPPSSCCRIPRTLRHGKVSCRKWC